MLVAGLLVATMANADMPYDATATLKTVPQTSASGRFTANARVVARGEADVPSPGRPGGARFSAKAVLDAAICADTLFRDEFE